MELPESAVDAVTLTVFGTPAPQGSKVPIPIYRGPKGGERIFTGKVVELEQNRVRIDAWRAEVEKVAKAALVDRNQRSFTGPVVMGLGLTLRRGKTVDRPRPSIAPDLDKLARSTGDAITDSGLWGDDGLVVAYSWLEKCYAGDLWLTGPFAGTPALDQPGAVIMILALDVPPDPPKPPWKRPAPAVLPARLEPAPVRGRLQGPVRPCEPSPALLEALRASGADPDAGPWA